MEEYSDILTKESGLTKLAEFRLDSGDNQQIAQHPCNTPLALKHNVNKQIDWLLDKKYIRQSHSNWASPMVTVQKPDGSARICIDYKRINAITIPMPFYMPHVEEVLKQMGKSTVISKIDLTKGYCQVLTAPEHIEKTSFVCHRGKFEFLRMPFGVKNAPAVFQALMLSDCKEYSSLYMDDIVIFSPNWDEHKVHVRQILQKLRRAGIMANSAKCHWSGTKMEFLGHLVGEGTMSIPDHRVQALRQYNRPVTKKGLRSFLSATSFYRRYVKLLGTEKAVLSPSTAKLAPSRVI